MTGEKHKDYKEITPVPCYSTLYVQYSVRIQSCIPSKAVQCLGADKRGSCQPVTALGDPERPAPESSEGSLSHQSKAIECSKAPQRAPTIQAQKEAEVPGGGEGSKLAAQRDDGSPPGRLKTTTMLGNWFAPGPPSETRQITTRGPSNSSYSTKDTVRTPPAGPALGEPDQVFYCFLLARPSCL